MLPARSRAAQAARPIVRQTQRRWESHHTEHQTTPNQAHPVEHGNTTESFGSRFFITLAALPLAWVAYDATASDAEHPSALTRWIGSYDSWQREYERRNDQHARLVQQAAADRNLFSTAQPSQMVDLRFPEQFNGGSPFNNVAGHRADLTELINHYHKRNQETDEKIAQRTPEERKIH